MHSISERILAVQDAVGKNQSEFCQDAGLSQNFLSALKCLPRRPRPSSLQLICNAYNVSFHWLETGEGEMFLNPKKPVPFGKEITEVTINGETYIKKPEAMWLPVPVDPVSFTNAELAFCLRRCERGLCSDGAVPCPLSAGRLPSECRSALLLEAAERFTALSSRKEAAENAPLQ